MTLQKILRVYRRLRLGFSLLDDDIFFRLAEVIKFSANLLP